MEGSVDAFLYFISFSKLTNPKQTQFSLCIAWKDAEEVPPIDRQDDTPRAYIIHHHWKRVANSHINLDGSFPPLLIGARRDKTPGLLQDHLIWDCMSIILARRFFMAGGKGNDRLRYITIILIKIAVTWHYSNVPWWSVAAHPRQSVCLGNSCR